MLENNSMAVTVSDTGIDTEIYFPIHWQCQLLLTTPQKKMVALEILKKILTSCFWKTSFISFILVSFINVETITIAR